ncbi:YlmH/Sll1252 family protein [Desulfoscipio sp. XC116]|uniref:YlmH family RNA-binding protein n=1 Tax=Desulfoscipio sp. XC116 TaxID=3144975 RepID=UPI00325B5F88
MFPDKFLSLAVNREDKETLARVLDLAEVAKQSHRPQVTDFYDPCRCAMIARAVGYIPDLAVAVDGGYPAAERSRVLISPDYVDPGNADAGLDFLDVRGNFRFKTVTHRDYLGALLGLGLRREKLGDILVGENGAQLIVAAEVAGFIKVGLTGVGRVRVTVQEISRAALKPPVRDYREIKVTVQSLRLDAVASCGFGLSRTKMAREIAAGKIYLNWRPCLNPSAPIRSGDMISARGRGRVAVEQTGGQTKKGRTNLLLHRYGLAR